MSLHALHQHTFEFFGSLFNDISEQLTNGVHSPATAFTKFCALGVQGCEKITILAGARPRPEYESYIRYCDSVKLTSFASNRSSQL